MSESETRVGMQEAGILYRPGSRILLIENPLIQKQKTDSRSSKIPPLQNKLLKQIDWETQGGIKLAELLLYIAWIWDGCGLLNATQCLARD